MDEQKTVQEQKQEDMPPTELSQEMVKLTDDIRIEARLRVESALAIEEEYDQSMAAVDWTRLKNSMVILYYLAKQVDPTLTREVFNKKIGALNAEVVQDTIVKALKLRLKNSPEPKLKELLHQIAPD